MADEINRMRRPQNVCLSPPPSDSPDPNANILYINNLHKNVKENMIMDILKKGLPSLSDCVVSAKMMASTDPTCVANGTVCCFVQFRDNYSATQAVAFINGREFYNQKVKVSWAVQNSAGGPPKIIGTSVSIYVGDLDDELDDDDLKGFFEDVGEVLSAKVVREPSTGQSKGFGFVSFSSKQDAENAIQNKNGHQLGKRRVKTNWASRNKANAPIANTLNHDEVIKAASPENCTVYVGNIPVNANPAMVKNLFCQHGTVVDTRIFVDKGFAFIKFSDHEMAANAIVKVHGQPLMGGFLKCWWGKDEEGQNFRSNHNNNYNNNQQSGAGQIQELVFSPLNPQMGGQLTKEQMFKNLQPMFVQNNMDQEAQEKVMNYIAVCPDYYNVCMGAWAKYQMQCQMMCQQMSQNQQLSQQYAMYYQQVQMDQGQMQPQMQSQMQPQMQSQMQPQMQPQMQMQPHAPTYMPGYQNPQG